MMSGKKKTHKKKQQRLFGIKIIQYDNSVWNSERI